MKQPAQVERGYLCHCLRITEEQFERILHAEGAPSYAELKERHGIGTVCTACEYEAKGKLADYLLLNPNGRPRGGGLRSELGFAWGQVRRKLEGLRKAWDPAAPTHVNYQTGLFFLRRDGLETHLAISNLRFPEHTRNVNGEEVTFQATLFGEDGARLAVSRPITVADGCSLELTPTELFPDLDGPVTGGLYVEYAGLASTGSLRPYGVLVNTSSDLRARCHYHDKFGRHDGPGFFHNSSPFEPGMTCWLALSNCQERPYESEAIAKIGGRIYTAKISVPPMGALWQSLPALFPEIDPAAAAKSPALFLLKNPQHVMVYFFWYSPADRIWLGQHH